MSPTAIYVPLGLLVEEIFPNFKYQLQLKIGVLEEAITTKDHIRQFLICMFGGKTDDGKFGFDPTKGVLLESLMRLKAPPFPTFEHRGE